MLVSSPSGVQSVRDKLLPWSTEWVSSCLRFDLWMVVKKKSVLYFRSAGSESKQLLSECVYKKKISKKKKNILSTKKGDPQDILPSSDSAGAKLRATLVEELFTQPLRSVRWVFAVWLRLPGKWALFISCHCCRWRPGWLVLSYLTTPAHNFARANIKATHCSHRHPSNYRDFIVETNSFLIVFLKCSKTGTTSCLLSITCETTSFNSFYIYPIFKSV